MKKLLLMIFVTACLFGAGCKGRVYTYVELLPPDWQWAAATYINQSGTVVGYGTDATDILKGFIYKIGRAHV